MAVRREQRSGGQSMHSDHYDLIVIGSGPAGEKGAARAAYSGKSVALIEKASELGGTTTSGAIPAKTLRETALNISGLRQRNLYGVDLGYIGQLDIATFMHRESHVHTTTQDAVAQNLAQHRIQRYSGCASFADPHTLHIRCAAGETTLTGEVILIATGSRPIRPPLFPYELPGIHDASTILSMDRLPNHLVVIGGGVVGCEFASLFRALGIDVTLIHSQTQLFTFVDLEIAERLTTSLATMGIRVVAPDHVAEVVATEKQSGFLLRLQSGRQIEADAVLAAVGRAGNVEELALDKAGVSTGERGLIRVNEFYQTSVPHIYAAGDVIGFPALTSTSMEQARMAIAHAFRLNYELKRIQHIPYGIWTIPEISMVGETEQALQAKGIPYVVGRAQYNRNPRGLILGDEHGLLKLLFAAHDRRLLGIHIIGQEACELIALGLMALETGATLNNLINLCFNFPSLADMYKYAAYDALGKFDALAAGPFDA
jgi:NAD(P) transhydrogenase